MSGAGGLRTLSHAERLDWLRLIRTETIGPVTFDKLIARFGGAGAALDALPRLAAAAGRAAPIAPVSRAAAEAELERAGASGAQAIAVCEPDYPPLLRAIPGRPPLIYLRGHATLLRRPAVAVIGARNASAAGRRIARDLAEGLGRAGVVVVSGLARGIDSAAHEAALASGTIAVVAGGVDVVYPPENAALQARLAAEGAVISETAPGVQPTARDFPRRNRLISGLSRGVVVVEAAERSGTLITARFALEQGREVFAVPGSPLDPRCRGANRLLREGAGLVETADDILVALAGALRRVEEAADQGAPDWNAPPEPEADAAARAAMRRIVREALGFTPVHRDILFREIDAPPGLIVDALVDLILAGEAEEHPGGRFSLSA